MRERIPSKLPRPATAILDVTIRFSVSGEENASREGRTCFAVIRNGRESRHFVQKRLDQFMKV